MCIFTLPVQKVSNTRIAVGCMTADRQLTVYQNETTTDTPGVAMLLPVPNSGPVSMVDMSPQLGRAWNWEDIDNKFFPRPEPRMGGWGAAMSFGAESKSRSLLAVTKCGGYQVSYAPTLDDLKRIDTSVFTLPADIEQVLRQHYANGFGFVVCMFQQGETKGHPIAYTHALLPDGRIFIPTRHEHGQEHSHGSSPKFGQVVHKDVKCDGCGVTPIHGIRYKCAKCDNFDYCSTCYTTNKDGHKDAHYFIQMEKPVQHYSNMAFGQSSQDHLDFDHSIYLINCVLLSSEFTVTDIDTADLSLIQRNHTSTCLHYYYPRLNSIQKVTIKNDEARFGRASKRIENGDYYAYPIWK